MNSTFPGLAACTIVSKNYLPFARTLARSFAEHHPGSPFFVLLVDRIEGAFDPAAEPFEVIEVETLGNIPDFPAFAFKYTILELNTAVKPFFLARLLERAGIEKLIYLDPDILLFRPLDELSRLLDEHSVVLTPHLTDPIDDDLHPSELSILQSGAYNLGFVALTRSAEVTRLLAWWQERMVEHCVVAIERGLFVDQKWLDLAPGLFEGVFILRSPAYNVAYWNLHKRRVTLDPEPQVNGVPMVFFHFSGFDPMNLSRVSKHQNRFTLGELPDVRALFQRYRDLLLGNGFLGTRAWPYAFGRFDNGVAIPDLARSLFFSLAQGRRRFREPFAAGEKSFFAWARGPAWQVEAGEPSLSRLLEHLYRSRPDLRVAFPAIPGSDLRRFAIWLAEGGAGEYGLEETFLEPLANLVPKQASPVEAAASQARRLVRRASSSDLARQAKFHLKRLLGEQRAKALKHWLRPGPADGGGEAQAGLRDPLLALSLSRFGVNFTGYLTTESGMGEGGRGIARALAHAGIPHGLHNLELGVASRRQDVSFSGFSTVADYDVNLFYVNADQAAVVYEHLGAEHFRGKYNIGFWSWELAELPERFYPSFAYFHEVWTVSTFCLDAISAVSPVPVRRVNPPVEVPPPGPVDRARFGLPADRFVFLFVFDYLSYLERKNPFGVIEAFRRAFRADDPVTLVLKTVNAEWNREGAERLARAAEGLPVVFFDDYLSKSEVRDLMTAADAYVSLHRSEGYGLTMAEAMALGKPVVATAYSGNLDFMAPTNSLPVGYRLIEITEDAGPYARGASWADPDLDHAAQLMRRLLDEPELARAIGEEARRSIATDHSIAATAATLRRRLGRVAERVEGPGADPFAE
ncbi:MAG TPA: glycosyltransferase [Thermoanaerobaculia bacterium]|nr:glycosyltransferase [Thermoanaerobaculia bacterium]